MKLPAREKSLQVLIILCCILVGLAIFVLLCESGLHWLGVALRGLGLIAMPFVIAWLLARLTRPLVSFLRQKLHLPASLSAFIITLLVLAIFVGLILLIYAITVSMLTEISGLLNDTDAAMARIYDQAEQFFADLGIDYDTLQLYLERGADQLSDWSLELLRRLVNLAAATPQMLFVIVITIIATYFWCRDEERVNGMIIHALPGRGGAIYSEVTDIVSGYAKLILMLILVAIIISVTGLLLCGAKHALAVGLLIGCFNIVPSLGPAVVLIPWAVWSLIMGRYGMAVGLIVIWALIVLSRYLILPRMMGKSQGIHPLAFLASLFIGLMLFGVVGIILGPVALAVGLSLIRQLRSRPLLSP